MASGKGAKVALGVGLVPSAFGAYRVYERVYECYDTDPMLPAIAIFAIGVLLVAFGIGKLTTAFLSIGLVFAAAGYVYECVRLGKLQHAARAGCHAEDRSGGMAPSAGTEVAFVRRTGAAACRTPDRTRARNAS